MRDSVTGTPNSDVFEFSDGSESSSQNNKLTIMNNAQTYLSNQNPISCNPPPSGDWTITESCALYSNYITSGNVIVDITDEPDIDDEAKVLMIIPIATLTIDFDSKYLMIKDGNKVMIYSGGKITSP